MRTRHILNGGKASVEAGPSATHDARIAPPRGRSSGTMRRAFAILLTGTLLGQSAEAGEPAMQTNHPYAGMWVTEDGRVRHELLPGGRYVEARGRRERAYEGRYEVTRTQIEYWDDTGFTADGDFVDLNTLHHGGMVLRRRQGAGEN